MADVLDPASLEFERLLRRRPVLVVKAREVAPPERSADTMPPFRGYPKGPLYTSATSSNFESPFPALAVAGLAAATVETYQVAKPVVKAAGDFARKHPLATLGLGVLAVGAVQRYLRAQQTPDSHTPVEKRHLRRRLPLVPR